MADGDQEGLFGTELFGRFWPFVLSFLISALMVNTLASFWGKPQKAKSSDKKAEAAPKPTDDKISEEEPIAAEKVLQVCDPLRSCSAIFCLI